ncbi:MAG: hypothetical protein A3I05_04165 [Deltaproteobacteria bacterium RIFCSPLOWO2_02_FULL_44_10]|nr:MAG: hypothetical protein A3C46_03685 [Deltaproteobacteria bacterium RIFCSPHIGHO2_02_FULL_44_16]OGQ46340.1 MAG: hypothetical protein A3I05_04165 [Deltaproteobacteria bacterium RIFCSPLOWO2_02_FULL_44_10]
MTDLEKILRIPACEGSDALQGVYVLDAPPRDNQAHIQSSDRLLEIDGKPIPSDSRQALATLVEIVEGIYQQKRVTEQLDPLDPKTKQPPNDPATGVPRRLLNPTDVVVLREGKKLELRIEIPFPLSSYKKQPAQLRLKWPSLVVESVLPGSAAELTGLKPGTNITHIDGTELKTLPYRTNISTSVRNDNPEMIHNFFEEKIGKPVEIIFEDHTGKQHTSTINLDPQVLGATLLWTDHLNHCGVSPLPEDIQIGFFFTAGGVLSVDGNGYFAHPTSGVTIGTGIFIENPEDWIARIGIHTQLSQHDPGPNLTLFAEWLSNFSYPFHHIAFGGRVEGTGAIFLYDPDGQRSPRGYGAYAFVGPIATYQTQLFGEEPSTFFISPMFGFVHLHDLAKCGYTVTDPSIVLPGCENGPRGSTNMMGLFQIGFTTR